MKIEVDRQKALRAISTGGAVGGRGRGNGEGYDDVNGEVDGAYVGGNNRLARGRSRKAVQTELKSILQDTERLTSTLIGQLRELKACGWNVGYL